MSEETKAPEDVQAGSAGTPPEEVTPQADPPEVGGAGAEDQKQGTETAEKPSKSSKKNKTAEPPKPASNLAEAAKALLLGKKDILTEKDLGDGKFVFVTIDGQKLRYPEDEGALAESLAAARKASAIGSKAYEDSMKKKRAERAAKAKADDLRRAKAAKR